MSTAITLVNQTLIMFLLAGVGYVLFRTKKISLEGSKSLANILIYIVLPCVIINGFLVERTTERLIGLLVSAAAAAILLVVAMIVSRLFFPKDAIASFAAAFSNAGFFGIPLTLASLGSGAVFYVAAFIAFLNLLQWTYGVSIMTGEKAALKPAAVLKAPFLIAIAIGLVLFFTQIPLPSIVTKTLGHLTGINTPLAMFTVGIYLAQTDLVKMLVKPRLYLISLVRLVVIPLLSFALLTLIPASLLDMKMALLLAAACPVGSNVAVYAQLHGKDYPYAVETVIISTLLSIITVPALVALAGVIW